MLHQDVDWENIHCVMEGSKTFTVASPAWRDSAYFTEGPGYAAASSEPTPGHG